MYSYGKRLRHEEYRTIYRIDGYERASRFHPFVAIISFCKGELKGRYVAEGLGGDLDEAFAQAKWWVDELEKRRPKL